MEVLLVATLFLALHGTTSCWRLENPASMLNLPRWAMSSGGQAYLTIAGLASLAVLVGAFVFGFFIVEWWLPLVQLVAAFVVSMVLDGVFGYLSYTVGALLFPPLSLVAMAMLVMAWWW